MVKKPEHKAPEQDSDYDGAWKDALRHHLAAFLAKYFAAMHAAIDWSRPIVWFDKVQRGSLHHALRLVQLMVLYSREFGEV